MATLTTLVCLALSAWVFDKPAQTADTKAYQKAYAFVLEGNWDQAEKAFAKLITDFPGTAWEDDAAFWRCYAKIESDLPAEQSFQCLKSFIEKWPGSQWNDDARETMAVLADEQEKQGKPQFAAEIKQKNKNWDQMLAILSALGEIGDDTSIQTVLSTLKDTKDPVLRAKIVLVLEGNDHASVPPALLNLLEKDPNDIVRKSVVQALTSYSDSKPVRDALEKLCLDPNQPERLRSEALQAFIQDETTRAPELLESFALEESSPEFAKTAIDLLSDRHDPKVFGLLKGIYGRLKNNELRHECLDAIANQGSPESLAFLADIVDKDSDEDIRDRAINGLGESENPKALPLLQHILENSKYSDDNRRAAASSIGDLKAPDSATVLKKFIDTNPSLDLFESCLEGLTEAEPPDLAAYFGALLKKTKEPERVEVILHALGNLGGEKARNQLIELLNSSKEKQ